MFSINHKNKHVAFSFEAIVASLVIAFAFFLDDIIDYCLERYIPKLDHMKWVQALIHMISIFCATLATIYTLHYIFGYGNVLIPSF